MKPFFSIGVPTYNRRELLKETLASILNQTFSNYEVIISNDFTEENILLSELGVDDPRFRLINQDKNLGPWRNHNYLAEISQGKYFAWLGDDDCMMPNFLESMHTVIDSHDAPLRIFTAYCGGSEFDNSRGEIASEVKAYDGTEFLNEYLSRKIKTVGHYGVFDREYLIESGGLENLGKGVYSPYNDNLLAIKAGLLSKVVYVDLPLLFFRDHDGSASHTSADIDSFITAQEDFFLKCKLIFHNRKVKNNIHLYLYFILKWLIRDIFAVAYRGDGKGLGFVHHLIQLARYARRDTGLYCVNFLMQMFFYGVKYLVLRVIKRLRKKVGIK